MMNSNSFYFPEVSSGGMLVHMRVLDDRIPQNWPVSRPASGLEGRLPMVFNPAEAVSVPGLISGIYSDNDGAHVCHPNASIQHGDIPYDDDANAATYLSKDDPRSPLHPDAFDLAVQQTREEMCRLDRLVLLRNGKQGHALLHAQWLVDEATFNDACPGNRAKVAAVWMAAI